ncbi:MAG: hypothetical protein U5L11_10465 [Arhodomonas sp.]|nr:hypothetical protein [Arhodomonas sp.]
MLDVQVTQHPQGDDGCHGNGAAHEQCVPLLGQRPGQPPGPFGHHGGYDDEHQHEADRRGPRARPTCARTGARFWRAAGAALRRAIHAAASSDAMTQRLPAATVGLRQHQHKGEELGGDHYREHIGARTGNHRQETTLCRHCWPSRHARPRW